MMPLDSRAILAPLVLLVAPALAAQAAEMAHIQVAPDNASFQSAENQQRFVPWGFNYDHDEQGRLIEEYWEQEWSKVEEDFREMQRLGANVIRIHLQFGKFMLDPATPNPHALKQLRRLVKLSEQLGLYLDLTGLGCYHKADVPAWYDRLSESDRWASQAVFWQAIAESCAESPAIFCYDLMNEPVVAGGQPRTDWLGPGFAGKHFVQYIAIDRAGRDRTAVARQWIGQLVRAIRKHDRRHLITVGLVPWSLDRPGLTSGFVPAKIADQLDFISVHLYPKTGELDEAIEILKGFSIGKPVLVEETFPLKCGVQELDDVMRRSDKLAAGWLGFYWGKTTDEYRQSSTIADALMAGWLELFQATSKATDAAREPAHPHQR